MVNSSIYVSFYSLCPREYSTGYFSLFVRERPNFIVYNEIHGEYVNVYGSISGGVIVRVGLKTFNSIECIVLIVAMLLSSWL